jgi:hypothetical protein
MGKSPCPQVQCLNEGICVGSVLAADRAEDAMAGTA